MSMREVTFVVDTVELFDSLQGMNGNTTPLGAKLVAVLLGDFDGRLLAGMNLYGVRVRKHGDAPVDDRPERSGSFDEAIAAAYDRGRADGELAGIRKAGEEADYLRPYLSRYQDEHAIVARIWKQLGSPTFAELAGRSIHDLIDEKNAEVERLRVIEARYADLVKEWPELFEDEPQNNEGDCVDNSGIPADPADLKGVPA